MTVPPLCSSILLGAVPPKIVGFSKQVSTWVERSPCPERSAESCRTSFPAVISRMYLPLSESLGSRIWSQISSRVVPALTRSLLSRRFSLNVRAKQWLTGLCPGQAGCLPSSGHPCPRLLSQGFVSRCVGTFDKYLPTHPFIIQPKLVPIMSLYLRHVLQAGTLRKRSSRISGHFPKPNPWEPLPHLILLILKNLPGALPTMTGPKLLQTVYTPFLLYLNFIPKDTWPTAPVSCCKSDTSGLSHGAQRVWRRSFVVLKFNLALVSLT